MKKNEFVLVTILNGIISVIFTLLSSPVIFFSDSYARVSLSEHIIECWSFAGCAEPVGYTISFLLG